ncbi:52 kDa repressor of the inhibitor of the protein kinase isoform X1 [Rhineura floridana]|uniref:52 kDa repressor of the inhibitor of the protein kinase isoform X1 n=1 Tax=Rhineura floridana TaxID=261503 RepID=UPI002AC81C87|nr:52 kDa repressor of the inhibitor of the protein kinase isoform X1 [Rhineura floridana]
MSVCVAGIFGEGVCAHAWYTEEEGGEPEGNFPREEEEEEDAHVTRRHRLGFRRETRELGWWPWGHPRSGCQRWVENCRRADLEDKTPDQLNKHYRLCAKHFETSMICRSSPYRTVLRDNAVPTIFDLTSHLNNPHSRHRKRIKELSEEEIRTLKQQKIDAFEQEKMNQESVDDDIQNPASEEGGDEPVEDEVPLTQEERENKDYLKSLFEILILMGKQNVPLDGHSADELPEGIFTPDNFQALLEFRINSGDEVLRKRFETTAVNLAYCSKAQQKQMLEICEGCVREETLREVRDSHFFSIITDEMVDLAGEEHLPVLVRFVDDSHNLREEFIGFLPYEADPEILAVKFHTTITEKWGLNMEYCRGQAYIVSSGFASKMKTVATRILEKYPQAVYTLSSSCALNIWLAKSIPVLGISIVLGTIEEVCLFFQQSPQLLADLDNVISILFQNSEERGNELKEIVRCHWTGRHDTFEIVVDLMQAFVLCLDAINDASVRWNSSVAGRAHILSTALADFDFVVTVVIIKNILSFTRAFGKNLQGQTSDVFFAASSLTAVLHSLNEVMENIEVYHEFWFEEATNLATKLDLPIKLPGKFCRAQQGSMDSEITPENYYKEALSIPAVEHIIQELKDIFSEQHLRALKCLSLVPSVMGQLKFNTSEEHHADMHKNDLPNPDTLSAELHCWRIKWKHRGKDIELPTTIYEALHLPDIKFFPNVYALLKVLCILPVMKVENKKFEVGRRRLKAYLKNTLTEQRSSNLALLNINFDIKHDLDLMVDTYIKLYPEKPEFQEEFLPPNNSESTEET